MSSLVEVLSGGLLAIGCFLVLTGAVGILRFPDFHSRMHPAAKGDSLGQACVLLGLALQALVRFHDPQAALKVLLVIAFLLVTAPTATHAMARSAHLAGLRPDEVPDEPDEPEELADAEGDPEEAP